MADVKAPRLAPGAVIYQVYPRSFLDTGGDGVGDLRGITARLGYIASLGVDAVWLSPIFPSPMADFGYDVSDYCGVDPLFGSLEDFDALVAQAHRLGLKVLLDQVYCHTSERHPWFQDSRAARDGPKADWYVWADARADGTPPNNWQSVFYGPAWTWDARRAQYYLHNFLPEQPQLDGAHPQVQEALLAVARFWLERGVDGFRLDAINFLAPDPALADNPPAPPGRPRRSPFDFQDHLNNQSQPVVLRFLERLGTLAEGYGGFLLAEVPGERALEEMRLYTAGSHRAHTAYGFDFLYAPKLDAALARRVLAPWSGEGAGWPAWAFSNHDAPRAVSRWAGACDPDAYARMLLLLLGCLRGYLCLYQGEELGLSQAEVPYDRLVDPEAKRNWPDTLGRDGARTPFPWEAKAPHAGFSTAEPWLPIDPRHLARAVDVQEADPGSTLAFARRVLALRREREALRFGELIWRDDPGDAIVFERRTAEATLFCAFNPGGRALTIGVDPKGWRVVLGTPGIDDGGAIPGWLAPGAGFVAQKGEEPGRTRPSSSR